MADAIVPQRKIQNKGMKIYDPNISGSDWHGFWL